MSAAVAARISRDVPLIFTAESVRGILDGRKVVTRRIFKPPAPCVVQPADRVWVKEAWADDAEARWEPEKRGTFYRADEEDGGAQLEKDTRDCGIPFEWKTPLFMHRWRSRITLAVLDVRLERLFDLTEEDAIAEGIRSLTGGRSFVGDGAEFASARTAYFYIWDGLHGKDAPHDTNPGVWRIAFQRVEAT